MKKLSANELECFNSALEKYKEELIEEKARQDAQKLENLGKNKKLTPSQKEKLIFKGILDNDKDSVLLGISFGISSNITKKSYPHQSALSIATNTDLIDVEIINTLILNGGLCFFSSNLKGSSWKIPPEELKVLINKVIIDGKNLSNDESVNLGVVILNTISKLTKFKLNTESIDKFISLHENKDIEVNVLKGGTKKLKRKDMINAFLSKSILNGNLDLAEEIKDLYNLKLNDMDWVNLIHLLENEKDIQREGVYNFITKNIDCLNDKNINYFYLYLAGKDDLDLLNFLLKSGIKLNDNWILKGLDDDDILYVINRTGVNYNFNNYMKGRSVPLLLCCGSEGDKCFNFLKHFKPVVENVNEKFNAQDLLRYKVTNVITLKSLNIDILKEDSSGRNFLHYWALSDYEPRSGWATLLRAFPSLLEKTDNDGLTAKEIQKNQIKYTYGINAAAKVNEFEKSLVRIEGQVIKKESIAAQGKSVKTEVVKRKRL